jgi:hypothetical protein
MNEEDDVGFCGAVASRVLEQYGFEDGGDLCFNLLEAGAIPESACVDEAARIVAMHIGQA